MHAQDEVPATLTTNTFQSQNFAIAATTFRSGAVVTSGTALPPWEGVQAIWQQQPSVCTSLPTDISVLLLGHHC